LSGNVPDTPRSHGRCHHGARLETRFVLAFTLLLAAVLFLPLLFIEVGHDHLGWSPAEAARTRAALLGVALLALSLGAAGSLFLARRITRPLARLVDATRRAARGDLDTRIELATGDEMEQLAGALNDMVHTIKLDQRAIEELNRDLEQKVRARTEDLSRTNEQLKQAYEGRKQAEAQLIQSEKMASLGQFVAGIAHEINTPSSAIGAAIFNITGYLEALAAQIPALAATPVSQRIEKRFYGVIEQALRVDSTRRRPSTAETRERSRELEAVLLRHGWHNTREMALTFSRLGLHGEIAALAEAAGESPPALCTDFLENVGSLGVAVNDIRLSIDAITRMVRALRSYSHLDQAEMAQADIHDGIETTLTILRNQIKYGIVVERKYSRLPPVTCNQGELNQVWTNIIHNAIQAMNGMGRITVETYLKEDWVAVRISDTGPGIPGDVLPRIFDPFFTTKDQGEGSGLGLGISQQIVKRHKGRIQVDSEPGRTSFEVLLPRQPRLVEMQP
jgi:signal transduction histidine kinase